MTEFEQFLGVSLCDLPKTEHYDITRRVLEGPHRCVLCGEDAVEAYIGRYQIPLDEQPGFWVDTCAEHGVSLRVFSLGGL